MLIRRDVPKDSQGITVRAVIGTQDIQAPSALSRSQDDTVSRFLPHNAPVGRSSMCERYWLITSFIQVEIIQTKILGFKPPAVLSLAQVIW